MSPIGVSITFAFPFEISEQVKFPSPCSAAVCLLLNDACFKDMAQTQTPQIDYAVHNFVGMQLQVRFRKSDLTLHTCGFVFK